MLASSAVLVQKANGEREPFHSQKLFSSLVNSGAEHDLADRITTHIAGTIREGDRTRDIYRRAFSSLRQAERPLAARYSVKHALLELGPSGYPFEDYLAELYRSLGYDTQTRVVVPGRCVTHELDLVAERGDERFIAEVKYHNKPGLKSDVKVTLYVHARFEDIAARAVPGEGRTYGGHKIITNTKFTEQAQTYAACAGIDVIGWDYPRTGNLRELINGTGVHPISCMTSLTRAQKQALMEQGVVLCKQIRERAPLLESLGLSDRAAAAVLVESDSLCKTPI